MREMHLHDLPWPRMRWRSRDNTVSLRVTLSYFIEPIRAPWVAERHRYASHGLRFDLKTSTRLTSMSFAKRLNQRATDEDEGKPAYGGAHLNGPREMARNTG